MIIKTHLSMLRSSVFDQTRLSEMRFQTSLLLFSFMVLQVQGFWYNINVTTGEDFSDVNATIFAILRTSSSADNVTLTPKNPVLLRRSSNYSFDVNTKTQTTRLKRFSFQWFDESDKLASEDIVIKSVSVTPLYVDPKVRKHFTQNFLC